MRDSDGLFPCFWKLSANRDYSVCQIFSKYLVFCGIGITNAELFERAQLEIRRNQVCNYDLIL